MHEILLFFLRNSPGSSVPSSCRPIMKSTAFRSFGLTTRLEGLEGGSTTRSTDAPDSRSRLNIMKFLPKLECFPQVWNYDRTADQRSDPHDFLYSAVVNPNSLHFPRWYFTQSSHRSTSEQVSPSVPSIYVRAPA